MNNWYQYRKENHLCVNCGEQSAPGKTRCIGCLQNIAAKQRMRYQDGGEAYRQARREYEKKWADKNRDHVREYHRKWYAENYKSLGDGL